MASTSVDLDREGLAQVFADPLDRPGSSRHEHRGLLRGRGPVKTYALEVDGNGSPSDAAETLHRLAGVVDLDVTETADADVFIASSDDVALFVDVLNPRYWLVHTASSAGKCKKLLKRAVWGSHVVDWCWFPLDLMGELRRAGRSNWFKTDFSGFQLLPEDGVADRRLRVQLEGEGADRLLDRLAEMDEYRRAAALSAVASRVEDPEFGPVEEVVQYHGWFFARSGSFDAHVGFVSSTIDKYAELVGTVEDAHRLGWRGDPEHGYELRGNTLSIALQREIADADRFLNGLFSCREPFRFWGVPREHAFGVHTVEAVDLHVGERVSMVIEPDAVHLTMGEHVCGNTALRLLANLQHHYDATAETVSRVTAQATANRGSAHS